MRNTGFHGSRRRKGASFSTMRINGPLEPAMRFDLVDLQLFIAVAEARSITGGADRAHLALVSASARIKGIGGSARH